MVLTYLHSRILKWPLIKYPWISVNIHQIAINSHQISNTYPRPDLIVWIPPIFNGYFMVWPHFFHHFSWWTFSHGDARQEADAALRGCNGLWPSVWPSRFDGKKLRLMWKAEWHQQCSTLVIYMYIIVYIYIHFYNYIWYMIYKLLLVNIWLIYCHLQKAVIEQWIYNVGPPSYVCWFRFAPITSSL